MTQPDRAQLQEACAALAACDPIFGTALSVTGVPDWRYSPPEYRAIARMIAFQQITTRAAASIWARVETALGEITPQTMLAASEDTLRGIARSENRTSSSINRRLCVK